MDMSLAACWDCPPTFVQSFVSLAVGLLLLLVAVVIRANHFVLARALGTVAAIVAIGWLLLTALGSWRFGVAWEDDYRPSALLTMVFMITPLAFVLAFGVLSLRTWRRAG